MNLPSFYLKMVCYLPAFPPSLALSFLSLLSTFGMVCVFVCVHTCSPMCLGYLYLCACVSTCVWGVCESMHVGERACMTHACMWVQSPEVEVGCWNIALCFIYEAVSSWSVDFRFGQSRQRASQEIASHLLNAWMTVSTPHPPSFDIGCRHINSILHTWDASPLTTEQCLECWNKFFYWNIYVG